MNQLSKKLSNMLADVFYQVILVATRNTIALHVSNATVINHLWLMTSAILTTIITNNNVFQLPNYLELATRILSIHYIRLFKAIH